MSYLDNNQNQKDPQAFSELVKVFNEAEEELLKISLEAQALLKKIKEKSNQSLKNES